MDPAPMLAFLKSQGLKPSSTVLDIGCGRLRAMIDTIGYLNRGRYYGLDIYESMFSYNGTHPTVYMKLEAAGLTSKKATFWQTDCFDCKPLGNVHPDFVLAQSVFSHIREPLVRRCLEQLRPHMGNGSTFFATFFRSSCGEVEVGRPHKGRPAPQPGVEEFDAIRYPDAVLKKIAEECGYTFDVIEDYPHPNGQKMGVFRRA